MYLARLGCVLGFVSLINACSVVSSNLLAGLPAEQRQGVIYMLPKALLPVRLVDNKGKLELEVLDPILVGDDRQTFLLKYQPSVMSNDNVKVTIDPKTNLLQSIDITAEDKTADILKKLAATAVLLAESARTDGAIIIVQTMIDPACNTECETIEKRFRPVLQRYLQRKVWECSAAIEKNADACKIYSLLSDNSNNITVSLKVEPLNIALTTEPSTKDRQAPNGPCEVGICYRPVMPYRITALLDTEENMVVTFLPNSAPAVVLSLNRSAFVTAKHQVMIKDGLLQTVSSDKQSEALAVASLPLEITKTIFTTIGELVQLKIDLSNKEEALATQKVAEIDARKELAKKLAERSTSTPEAALLGTKSGVLVSASAGLSLRTPFIPKSASPPPPIAPPPLMNPGSSGTLGNP